MEVIVAYLLNWGLAGLALAAFTESFCSPILPDILLIPLALANPENAIYFGLVTTVASILGGFVGYGIGQKIGLPAAKKMIPAKYEDRIRLIVENNAKWAIFVAAISPIPYKLVCITAGALKVSLPVFIGVSLIGRAKRFLLEGLLIYYYGPKAEQILTQHSADVLILSAAGVALVVALIYLARRYRRNVAADRG